MMEKLVIMKIGGSVIDDETKLNSFLKSFAKIPGQKLLVHGGGLIASRLSENLKIPVQMLGGRRVTSRESLDIVTMVYGGLINKTIVAKLHGLGVKAIGLSGADAGIIEAHKRPAKPHDYGFVGDIDQISHQTLDQVIKAGMVTVLAPLSVDPTGQILNTNADTVAAEVCRAMSQVYQCSLYYLMDFKGVLADMNDPNSIISQMDRKQFNYYVEKGAISKGMLPKLENALRTKEAGAAQVIITDVDGGLALSCGRHAPATRLV